MKPYVLEPLAVRQLLAHPCLLYRRSGMLELQPHYFIVTALGSWLAACPLQYTRAHQHQPCHNGGYVLD